jgi:hypothetical protein
VTKFSGHLAGGMSFFNLAPVCIFCAQYFDPDYEDGVVFPAAVNNSNVTKFYKTY